MSPAEKVEQDWNSEVDEARIQLITYGVPPSRAAELSVSIVSRRRRFSKSGDEFRKLPEDVQNVLEREIPAVAGRMR